MNAGSFPGWAQWLTAAGRWMWLWCRSCGTKATSRRALGRACEVASLPLRDPSALVRRGPADGVDAAVVDRGRVVAGAVKRPGHRVAGHRDHRGRGGGVVLDVGQAVDLGAVQGDPGGVVLQGQRAVLV